MSNRIVNYAAEGWSLYGYAYSDQSETQNPVSDFYNFYTPVSWYPISCAGDWYQFGMNSYATVSRSGSSWQLHLPNQR